VVVPLGKRASRSLLRQIAALAALILLTVCSTCAAKPAARVRLRVVFWAGIEEQKVERENVEAFNAAHPDFHVALESIPDNYLEKLVTAFAAGKPPDVLLLDSVLVPKFIEGGALLDLAPYLTGDSSFDSGDFFSQVYDIARRGEEVYALPKDFTPMVVYYNRESFDAAGVPYPQDGWSWEDFLRTARALTTHEANPLSNRYGFMISPTPYQNIFWLWQNGGDVLSPDGTRATGYLDSPESVRAVRFYTDLLLRERVAPDPSTRLALGGEIFQTGKVAMVISGHWWMPTLRASEHFNLDKVGVVGLPQGSQRVNVIYESGWAVARQSRHPRQAVELAEYLAGPEAQRRRTAVGLAISANRRVAAGQVVVDPREQVFLEEIEFARAPWGSCISEWSVVEDLLAEGIERVILGYATPEESMRQTARLIDAELSMFRGEQ